MLSAALLTAVVVGCYTDEDCALNGYCHSGECICDDGWGPNPDTDLPCSYLGFDGMKVDRQLPGYKNETAATWGSRPVYWPQDKQWHVFTAMFAEGCSVGSWKTNSFIFHATGPSPVGPWTGSDVSVDIFAHNPQVLLHPDGTWLMYFIGGWHIPQSQVQNCSNNTVQWPPQPEGPGMNNTADGCGPGENTGCGIRYATAASPYGPWDLKDLVVTNNNQSSVFDCAKTNPAPYILSNGSLIMAFNGGFCHHNTETLGIMTAPHYNSPWTIVTLNPIAPGTVCSGSQFGEDPTLWQTPRGFHLLAHAMCNPGVYSMYGYSLDGITWKFARDAANHPVNAYPLTVTWTDNTTTKFPQMERPIVVFDPTTNLPFMLANGVSEGSGSMSWGLYRKLF